MQPIHRTRTPGTWGPSDRLGVVLAIVLFVLCALLAPHARADIFAAEASAIGCTLRVPIEETPCGS